MKTILHISTSHYPNDNRIYYKEIVAASRAGYKVYFIIPASGALSSEYCTIIGLRRSGNKFHTYIVNQIIGFYRIYKLKPDIVQFHDPELILSGLLLSYFMKNTEFVYDIHEDNYTALRNRGKANKFVLLKRLLARVVRCVEVRLHDRITTVIAEKYYRRIFPRAIEVLNYPVYTHVTKPNQKRHSEYHELIYTGNITQERGLEIYKQLVSTNKKVRVHLVGRIPHSVAQELKGQLGADAERLVIPYVDEFVDPEVLRDYYHSRSWTAGLAVFPRNEHYFEKELTKLFEYMMHAIPVVCSNFPAWENIILHHNAGLSVAPENIAEISATIDRLGQNEDLVKKLGENGYKALVDNYQWVDQERRLIKLYERIKPEC